MGGGPEEHPRLQRSGARKARQSQAWGLSCPTKDPQAGMTPPASAIQRIPRFSSRWPSEQHPGEVGQAPGRSLAEERVVFPSAAGSPRKKSPPRTLLSRSGRRGSSGLAKSRRRRAASQGRRPASGLPRRSMARSAPLDRRGRRLSDVRGKKLPLKPPPLHPPRSRANRRPPRHPALERPIPRRSPL